jgi:hypothetical protein
MDGFGFSSCAQLNRANIQTQSSGCYAMQRSSFVKEVTETVFYPARFVLRISSATSKQWLDVCQKIFRTVLFIFSTAVFGVLVFILANWLEGGWDIALPIAVYVLVELSTKMLQ